MKAKIFLLLIIGLFLIFGCKNEEITKELTFTKSISTSSFDIPAKHCCGGDQDCDGIVDLNDWAKENGTTADLIKSIKIKSAKIITTEDDNFDNFKRFSISLKDQNGLLTPIMSKTSINRPSINPMDIEVNSDLELVSVMKNSTATKFNTVYTLQDSTKEAQTIDFEITYEIKTGAK